ncbi:MAG TPA: DUF1614 domain-containing protein [Candidatus Binataceae bacterium]|nr:DUF1614 domain-containing protein [Candidatus Binataceae bacterium]
MYPPVSSPMLGLLALLLIVLVAFIEIGVIEYAYARLGISHRAITSLLLLTIAGSLINIPVASVSTRQMVAGQTIYVFGVPYVSPPVISVGHTVIAINLGGALIPTLLSLYLLLRLGGLLRATLATALVAVIVHRVAQIVPGVGIAVPTLLPGIVAAMAAWLVDKRRRASIAYVAGTMGCLIGADLANLARISQMHAPMVSIGGAGTFDGVFVAGIVAVLLA